MVFILPVGELRAEKGLSRKTVGKYSALHDSTARGRRMLRVFGSVSRGYKKGQHSVHHENIIY